MSYAIEVKVYNDPEFYPNGIRLATKDEAEAYGRNKVYNWTMADEYRVVESEDAVNYQWDPSIGLVSVEAPV
jgi:hypothetical protein